jgi:hypothetical protein
MAGGRGSYGSSSGRDLADTEKSLNERALSAHGHSAESFEPSADRDCGGRIKPLGEFTELFWRNFA